MARNDRADIRLVVSPAWEYPVLQSSQRIPKSPTLNPRVAMADPRSQDLDQDFPFRRLRQVYILNRERIVGLFEDGRFEGFWKGRRHV